MTLHEWIHPIWILFATALLTWMTHLILRRLHTGGNCTALRELAPSISNILFLIGLRLAVATAPLEGGRFEVWVDGILYIAAVLIFLRLIHRAAFIGIEWSTSKSHHSQTLQLGFVPLMRNVMTLFIFFTGTIMILKHFNYDVLSLLTALGVGSLAVGLAAKDTLAHMISGFVLIIDRNLHPGDRINLSGTVGEVTEIGLRSTQIRIGDGNTLIVPNSDLVNTKILNLSLPTREVSCSTQLRFPYTVPFSKIKELCLSVIKNLEQLSPTKGITVNLASLSEGYQLIQVSFWVTDLDQTGGALTRFNEQLLLQLEREKISLMPAVKMSS